MTSRASKDKFSDPKFSLPSTNVMTHRLSPVLCSDAPAFLFSVFFYCVFQVSLAMVLGERRNSYRLPSQARSPR